VRRGVQVGVALALLLLGAAAGVATVALHDLAWGLLLAVAATAVTTYALSPGWSTRLPFVLGWDLMVVWLAVPRSEGDYLVSQDWTGYVVLGVGVVLLVVGIGTLPRPGHVSSGASLG
jgi:hypothetical protein